ncbi:MAG TPA: small basic protein [Candidatus Omnitrophota bacterium]|nr:small basic protein [Candidatus Omnitrophota bacterium]MDD5271061.1 small basic protein [Candidatus Omnitrophota bacterium]MDD5737534.1 small basic protein [Candidatus Omnitrophota bacterium]HOX10214.1 small basic protein [Candidatus Omnitrophota bacterium]
MSIHPSLRPSKGRGHRSVFKRFERIKMLSDKDKWGEKDSVFGLPKVKSLKIKVKKEKSEAKVAAEGAEAAPGAAAPGAAPAAKAAAAPAKKEQAKAK